MGSRNQGRRRFHCDRSVRGICCLSEYGGSLMKYKPRSRMHVEDPVWCDQCQVRIAPYEQAVMRGTKTLHERCSKRTDSEAPSMMNEPRIAQITPVHA